MNLRRLAMLGWGTAILAGSFGCSSAHDDAAAAGGSNASAGNASAGNASLGGGTSSGGAGGGAGATDSACAAHSIPLRTQGTVLSLAITPTLDGKPFAFGQPNALTDGGSLVPLNFRFYISQVQLLKSGGDPVPVDLVTATGELEPYGVHLFNAEDDQTSRVRVLAPAGDYVGIDFGLGIKLGCNQQAPSTLDEPLSDVSQMTWPHTGGFLFLRYEGRYTAADGSAVPPSGVPSAVHMGGNITQELAPRVSLPHSFTISPTDPREMALSLSMDELFKGATANIDVSDVPVGIPSTPESVAGERLRRGLPGLHLFAFIVP
jgi:hypothetical protein